jgi:hypothetical protein
MANRFFLYLFFCLFILSCTRIVRLSDKDYSWMPYKGNETLVFKSNLGERDTIFFIRKDTLLGLPDPALSTAQYEIAAIFCKHPITYLQKGLPDSSYFEYYFFQIKKTMTKKAEIVIDLSAKDAKFYRISSIKIDSLDKIKSIALQTSYRQYNDVYVIVGEDYLGGLSKRSNFVRKLYWSKSCGLVRYDKMNGEYWEIIKK